ncbi:hypothetical protein F383_27117 [Gossypium arboreum]|uniref:Uncharacterized protein n=1 Tax=Gossypium arboreum TaxID=29729 RepID=A0A0B0MT49_GOSAR|nr:hypothetical protein F383_27117 [Gossypium arboreum]
MVVEYPVIGFPQWKPRIYSVGFTCFCEFQTIYIVLCLLFSFGFSILGEFF